MEYLRGAKVTIYRDSNKSSDEVVLSLGEWNEDETMEEFIQRVNKKMREVYLEEFEQ
jgi:hypothetical protein